MSTSIGAILVLPSGKGQPEQVEEALGRWLEGASRAPQGESVRWDLREVADASMFTHSHEVGFDFLVLRFSSRAYAEDRAGIQAWVRGWFEAAAPLQPLFGFLTLNDLHLDDPWLRENVLIPVLMEEWDDLREQPFELTWVG